MQRHDVDPTSLAFGLLFTIAGLLLLGGPPEAGSVWLGWAGPAVAVGIGLLIVAAVRPRQEAGTDGALDPTDDARAKIEGE